MFKRLEFFNEQLKRLKDHTEIFEVIKLKRNFLSLAKHQILYGYLTTLDPN